MILRATIIILSFSFIAACQTNSQYVREKPPIFYLTEQSNDPEYGKIEQKPIKVGGWKETGGHGGQRWFFDMLSGPKGERLIIERVGACCWHHNPEAYKGQAALDKYHVYIGEAKQPITLYLNSYEYEPPKIPMGFGTSVKHNNAPQPTPKSGAAEL